MLRTLYLFAKEFSELQEKYYILIQVYPGKLIFPHSADLCILGAIKAGVNLAGKNNPGNFISSTSAEVTIGGWSKPCSITRIKQKIFSSLIT